MTENTTDLTENEINELSSVTTPETSKTLNSKSVIEEIEPIPNPWDNAPEGVIFYKEIKNNGQIIGFTIGAELAYKIGLDLNNYLNPEDIQQSDKDFNYYLKELCPMKTEEDKFNEAKQNKLSELHNAAESALKTAGVKSSLGFKIDANEDAVRNLNGLVDIGHNDVSFCDYDNVIHEHITAEQVKIMRNEVLLNGQNLYAQKWTIRQQINEAESIEALNNIQIEFTMLDFSGD